MRKVSPKSFRDTAQLFKELGLEDSMQQGNVTTMQPGQSFRLPRDIPDLSTLMSSSRKAGHKVIESVPLSEDNQKLFVALQDLQLTIDATTVEDAALRMTLDLLNLSDADWPGRTLTTGATASNLLGLACGRNFALQQLGVDVGEEGFSGKKVPVFCAGAHASIKKAASIIGIGRSNCIDVSDASDKYGVAFDTPQLGLLLRQNKELEIGSIVVAAIGEVNTGLSTPNIALLRTLCDTYGAWLHIDAAFAVFAGVYGPLARMLLDLRYGDSLCIDGHKWLNVPYDCATFYTKHLPILKNVCASGPAAYLTSSQSTSQSSESIESPLNIGIENSRRFRAFPLYATLVAYGRAGYADMIHRNLDFARSIDNWLRKSVYFEVLTPQPAEVIGCNLDQGQFETTNIVLFTVRTDSKVPSGYHDMNDVIAAINSTSALYVTGTVFHGRPAARLAVSNWRTGLARESRTGGNTTEIQRSEDLGIVLSTLARLLPRHEDGA
ncbi:protein of unknown function [Taphrina deformans PYCC 5710]|uniref:Uncharacterized protein n=1 Tax=Taphrina deformans (strain PYCC 5710 / ATCC 11124 / CBS 356.35 / IMI 108563 / JCM 9778 / NBRC 8474) TaxID=1097556 RepID=R4XKQ5_TAPDE|nr:protein of unknown function [Taphrina deformans PYCC 5710]|eukprot:CCG85014.1 protein of unknown function [Taphrina deformans PYCC 5710]